MTNIARTRRSRWAIGLSVSGVLLLVSLVCLATAAGVAAATTPDELTAAATAEVIDVDTYGDPDWLSAEVDLRFTAAGGEVIVTWLTWPDERPVPQVGDEVEVMYDPADPEFAVQIADIARAAAAEPPPDLTGVLATSGVAGGLALIGFGLTTLWARRLPRPEVISPWQRYPGYGYPVHGAYPGYGGYPAYGGYPGHGGYPGYGYPAPAAHPGYGQHPGYGAHPAHGASAGYGYHPRPAYPAQYPHPAPPAGGGPPAPAHGQAPDINPAALRPNVVPPPGAPIPPLAAPAPPSAAPAPPPASPPAAAPQPDAPGAAGQRWPAPR